MSLLDNIIRSSYKTPFLRCIYIININSKLQLPIYFNYGNSLCKFNSNCHEKKFTDTNKFKAFKEKQAKMQGRMKVPKWRASFRLGRQKFVTGTFCQSIYSDPCDDGYPVHLKGGIFDKILYHVTVVGCIIGIAQSIRFIYSLANT